MSFPVAVMALPTTRPRSLMADAVDHRLPSVPRSFTVPFWKTAACVLNGSLATLLAPATTPSMLMAYA